MTTNDIAAGDLPANDETSADDKPVPAEATADFVTAADTENVAKAAGVVIALAARAEEAEAVAQPADGLVTVRPKPEKRKNAKERAKERVKERGTAKSTTDGTTPMTAKAKSKVQDRVKDKAAKLAEKARKADTKAHKISAAKAAKAARAA